ncbi:MAG: hypothetical protein AB8G95_07120 [Anaerolineae bacterium]
MDSELFLPSLMTIIPVIPLFIVVMIAIGYAVSKQPTLGRPATLVIVGGAFILVSLIINSIMNIVMVAQAFSMQTLGTVIGISSFVTMIISTIGWGMILYAVFADRKMSEKLDF